MDLYTLNVVHLSIERRLRCPQDFEETPTMSPAFSSVFGAGEAEPGGPRAFHIGEKVENGAFPLSMAGFHRLNG